MSPSRWLLAIFLYGASRSHGKSGSLTELTPSLPFRARRNYWVIALLSANFARTTGRTELAKELFIDRFKLTELAGDIIFIVDRFDRTYWLACAAIDTFIRLDVEHPPALVNAINWALLDTRLVFHIDTWPCDDVRQRIPLTRDSRANYAASLADFHSMLVSMANHSGGRAPEAEDIGSRVTIRLHDEEPGKFRDVLGHLVDLTHVRDKHGVLKAFDPNQIVIWKKVD